MTDTPPTSLPTDWTAIRREWCEGSLSVREIGRLYGVANVTVHRHAEKESWPPRLARAEREQSAKTLTGEILPAPLAGAPVHSFGRVINMIRTHRAMIGRLNAEIALCMEDITEHRAVSRANGRKIRLDETESVMSSVTKAAQALHRLIPLERHAMGLAMSEGPSEFDMFDNEQLAALDAFIREGLGMEKDPSPFPGSGLRD